MSYDHVLKINRVNATETGAGSFPVYTMRDGSMCRTIAHPMGWSDLPDYRLGDDGKFYRTEHHTEGESLGPEYEFGPGGKIYPVQIHGQGPNREPEFEVTD